MQKPSKDTQIYIGCVIVVASMVFFWLFDTPLPTDEFIDASVKTISQTQSSTNPQKLVVFKTSTGITFTKRYSLRTRLKKGDIVSVNIEKRKITGRKSYRVTLK